MTNIDNISSNNILLNTSFNPFEENIIKIRNNKSKTVKDFFYNTQNKPFINQMGKNFIIKNSKIKRENILKKIKDKLSISNSFISNHNLLTPITNYSSLNKFDETIKKPLPKIRSIINLRKKELNKNKDDNDESFKRDYYYEEYKILNLKRTQLRKNISLNEMYTQESKKLKNNNKFQFFGSSSSKYNIININNISNDNIGPGSYFKDERPFLKKKFFKSNSQKVFSLQKKENEKILFPGPGDYNISTNFIKKPISNFHCFNSCEKRFNEKIINENFPGPGKYIKLNNWDLKNKFNLKKYIFKKENENFIIRSNDNNISPFNYNLNNYSIEKKNEKQIKKNYVPFGVQSKKFIQIKNSTGENIGPGSYIKNIININKKNNNIHFYNKNYKDKSYSLNNLNLPISYGEDSYFDWHKKSFNIQYV